MKIKILGYSESIKDISKSLKLRFESLHPLYKQAIEDTTRNVATAAIHNLNRPSWLLSRALGSKVKVYRDGKIIFGVVEALGERNPQKNTPAYYAWYQEHGYHVDPQTVKRGSKRRFTKKKGYIVGYRKQEGKHFFEKAFKMYSKEFVRSIEDINKRVLGLKK